jgi:formamidopyrimidine-DNA glycosylase
MPELPEVETIVQRLNSIVGGSIIDEVIIHRDKNFQGDILLLDKMLIKKITRRAKLIRFHLKDGLNLLAHLKMTGQFIFVDGADKNIRIGGGHPTADWVQELPSKHTRVEFSLIKENGQAKLFFNDMRTFGWIRLLTDQEVDQEYQKYGPDIHSNQANLAYFYQKLQKTGRKIKQVIMDNSVIAGVGNIYACDGLNLAGIHPERPANSLSEKEVKKLLSSLKKVINLGIKLGGATIDNYKNVDGFSGSYQNEVMVYGLEGEACKNCPGIIQKSKIGGRGTYFCPRCQV